jgi:hypothetical protein
MKLRLRHTEFFSAVAGFDMSAEPVALNQKTALTTSDFTALKRGVNETGINSFVPPIAFAKSNAAQQAIQVWIQAEPLC